MIFLKKFLHGEEGQDLVEYGLLACFVSVAAVATLTTLGIDIQPMYDIIGAKVAAGS